MMNIDETIKARITQKVLAETRWEVSESKNVIKETVDELLDLAVAAPCHYMCAPKYRGDSKELKAAVPYRFYILDKNQMDLVIDFSAKKGINLGKIQNMMWAADVVLISTWLPHVEDEAFERDHVNSEAVPFEGSITNMEHIAAASTAVQNILLGATSRGIPNYWSSGGALRQKELRDFLDISLDEILLGAIFLYPKDTESREVNIKTGSLRGKKGEKNTWSKWIDIQG